MRAPLAVVARQGLGKLRHAHAHYLWAQDTAEKGELEYRQVKGRPPAYVGVRDGRGDTLVTTLFRGVLHNSTHQRPTLAMCVSECCGPWLFG